MGVYLNSNVTALNKIGPKTAKLLKNLEIETVEDLLYHFPAYYRDFRAPQKIAEIAQAEIALVRAKLTMPPRWIRRFGKTSIFSFEVADGTGVLDINIFNLPFLLEKYKAGQEYLFYGKPKVFRNRVQMDNPEVFQMDSAPSMMAYYPLTAGINQRVLRQAVKTALETLELPRVYSSSFYQACGLRSDLEDFSGIHLPENPKESELARRSLAKKELLLFHRMMELSATKMQHRTPLEFPEQLREKFLAKLPFACTGAQKRVMGEIEQDLRAECSANRLVQGDVGSGKTAVALYAAYAVQAAGGQSVLMAPTELLADQHFSFAKTLFGERVCLLKGSSTPTERKEIFQRLADGEIALLIGTHAVLYGDLPFRRLELLMVDEQHRFGVQQRSALLKAHPGAHMVVFSATPIPRSLALILYGNADISVLDERPPGRTPPATHLVSGRKREDMYRWIEKKVQEGEKVYIVCPLMEPSEGIAARSVQGVWQELRQSCPALRTDTMYGKMSAAQKQEVMERFRRGETQVLISTTVVEVGVDVPDARIMVIENADRFGLAQLHQLRGRVGRGSGTSYCYLVSDGSGLERLKILKNCNDGFEIARQDLALRGTGEFFGQRQHGRESFRAADLLEDADLALETKKILEELEGQLPKDYQILTQKAREKLEERAGGRGEV